MAKQQRPVPRAKTPPKGASRPSGRPSAASRTGRGSGRPVAKPKPATLGTWIAGGRPQTLPLAIVPVALGTGAAALHMENVWDHWVRALLCLAVALALQIGVNYANDYSDGRRGVDADRIGPERLVGSGRASARSVLVVALVFFGLAAAAGVVVVWRSGHWWLLAVGALALVAAWFYTGGRRPYGYLGLGELAVLVFFGIVPTAGTMFVQVDLVNLEAWLGGGAVGALAAAVLVANNARDRERDAAHGKRTLAVLLGGLGTRILYIVLVVAPFGILAFFVLFYPWAPYVYFALVAGAPAMLIAATARTAREWGLVMKLTLVTAFAYGVGLAAAFAF